MDLWFFGQMFKDDCVLCRRTSRNKNVEIHAKLLMVYGLSLFAFTLFVFCGKIKINVKNVNIFPLDVPVGHCSGVGYPNACLVPNGKHKAPSLSQKHQ